MQWDYDLSEPVMQGDDAPLDEFKREMQQQMRQLAVMADQVKTLAGKIEEHSIRLQGFSDTLQNMRDRDTGNFR